MLIIALLLVVQAPLPAQDSVEILAERCAAGTLDDPFLEACRSLIREDALRQPVNASLPEDFFPWLETMPRLRDPAYLAMATVSPKVASNLQLLRDFDKKLLLQNATLALAFAAAWSQGAGSTPERYWVDSWLTHGREIPSLCESFVYYVESEKEMRFPLQDAPWQVLAHLADSLVPIEERLWAVDRYRKRKTPELRNTFAEVPYTLDPARGDSACTLESFLRYGGPCTHNVQFTDGIFDSFGTPSGWAGGPGHTYPYWFESSRRELSVHRTNELGNRNGKIRDPLGPGYLWEDDLRLLVAAMNHSVQGHQRAAFAAWAYRRVLEQERAAAAPILIAAVRDNPYCQEALSAVTDATALRQLPSAGAAEAWAAIRKALVARPFDLIPLLERALPAFGAEAPNFAGELSLLDALERKWEEGGSSELTARLPFWRARSHAARGELATARQVLMDTARETVAAEPHQFALAMDALIQLLPDASGAEKRLDLMRSMIALAEPKPRAGWSNLHQSRFHGVRRLVRELNLLDRAEEAENYWYEELLAARGKDPGTQAPAVLAGGSGGGPFEEAPEAAELVGLHVSTTSYNGRTVIGSVQGIYEIAETETLGARFGQVRAEVSELRAPTGWRIAGIVAAGSDRLDGLQLVLTPRARTDSRIRMSAWIGSRGDREILIGGAGVRVIGIRGRAGADVDAFGLVGTRL